ncbi:hypothetical protein [Nocardia mangyaensis]|uniref:hypothetical protein n=1 Tax=Nocardia mangyaensis TaxID=2213200 RepID=UPI0012EC04B3|nr:hypothetical protein [Nocardia mangyaensis]
MTSPGGETPDSAYSGPGARGIAGLAAMNAESARAAVDADIAGGFAGIPEKLANVVRAGMHEFAAQLCEAVTGITGGLIDLRGWATALRAKAEQALQESTTAKAIADSAVTTVEDNTEAIRATGARVQVVLDGLPIRPYWETMNLTEEPSFPRTMLHQRIRDISNTARPGYTQHNWSTIEYVYVWNPGTGQYEYQPQTQHHAIWTTSTPAYATVSGTVELAFIRCRYNGGRKIVTYLPEAVANPCELYVLVGRVLADGNLRIEWVSDDQTPLITGSRSERSVELAEEVVFEVGETAFVGIHQRGTGNPRPLLGVADAGVTRQATAWPPRGNARFTIASTITAGTTIAAGTLDFTSLDVPYVALSKSLIVGDAPKRVLYEDFQHGSIPQAFARMSSVEATVVNGVFVVSGGADGARRYLNAQPLNYDDQRVTGTVIGPSARHAWLMLRSAPDNRYFVSANVTQSAIGLYRYSDGTWTALSSTDITVASGTAVRLSAVGDVFTVQCRTEGSWIDVLTYTDTDSTLPKGSDYRYTGLGTERSAWINGGGWDDWKAQDL